MASLSEKNVYSQSLESWGKVETLDEASQQCLGAQTVKEEEGKNMDFHKLQRKGKAWLALSLSFCFV